jgi:WD40 repeat protein
MIAAENMNKVTELAHWPVIGWVKNCLLFSPDSQLLAFALDEDYDTAIQLRDVATGTTTGTLTGLTGRVEGLAFRRTGKLWRPAHTIRP